MKSCLLDMKCVTAKISHQKYLQDISWQIDHGAFWVVLGTNASGKSGLGRLIAGQLDIVSGSIDAWPEGIGYVSFEKHAEIMEDLIKNDDTDFMDRIDTGTPVRDFIAGKGRGAGLSPPSNEGSHGAKRDHGPGRSTGNDEITGDDQRIHDLAKAFGIDHLLHRGIRFLSTGEIRKAMICQALFQSPKLLILDEPYDGVDVESRQTISQAVAEQNAQGVAVVLILNRFNQIPPEATHILYISDCRIEVQGSWDDIIKEKNLSVPSGSSHSINPLERLHTLHISLPETLPERIMEKKDGKMSLSHFPLFQSESPDPLLPLVKMRNVTVQYGDHVVLDRLNWEVKQGEHWKISGPNGAGKSTLLSLINGDNPQAYQNAIELFGRRRGTGESIWDIKRHTGMVSSRFQLDYRVSSSILGVVISGFFDSIGLYKSPTKQQKAVAMAWLQIIGMEKEARKAFKTLSYGEQRMVLIVRAMVKHPTLLILDEPCQGLDEINRRMVLKLIDHIGKTGRSTLLYVTHHDEDRLECIQKELRL